MAGVWLIMWGPIHKVTLPFDHVLWDLVTKTTISPLPRCLLPPNFAEVWLTIRGAHQSKHMALWSRVVARSRDKLKPWYLHYCNDYGQKTWYDTDFPWVDSTHKITWTYNHVVWQDRVTNQNHYASPATMSNRLGRMGVYYQRLPSVKS